MKKIRYRKTDHVVDAVDQFPLSGAIIRYRCIQCGCEGGQPFPGTPAEAKKRRPVGSVFVAYCTCRKPTAKGDKR